MMGNSPSEWGAESGAGRPRPAGPNSDSARPDGAPEAVDASQLGGAFQPTELTPTSDLRLPARPLTEAILREARPRRDAVNFDSLDPNAALKELHATQTTKDEGKTSLREMVGLTGRFLRDLWQSGPSMVMQRATSTVLSSGGVVASLYAGGQAVKHLIPNEGAIVPSKELMFWAGASIVAGMASLFATKWQRFIVARHDLRIRFENFKQIASTIARIPPNVVEQKEVNTNVTKVRRSEWMINSLCQASFNLGQSSVTTAMAGVALLSAPGNLGWGIAAGCLVFPGILSVYSYNRQAERTDAQARQVTEKEKRNNYNRVSLMNPSGVRDLYLKLKSGTFVESLLTNFGEALRGKESTVRTNSWDQARTDGIGHLSTHAGWVALGLGVVQGAIDMGQFTFLASTLWQARRSLDILCQDLGRVGENLRFMKPLYDLEDLVSQLEEVREPVLLESAPGVKIENLVHSYPGSDRVALEIPELSIAPGLRVALVGDNGGGKTTFVKLLGGIYTPSHGEITVGGYNTKQYVPLTAYIAQDRERFIGLTVQESYNMSLIDGEGNELSSAAREALDGVISKKKFGMSTRQHPAFEDGSGFSGGEEQILDLIGSMASPARMKVRDEAFSALSPPNEVRLTEIIEEERGKCTLFDVTHRLAAARTADLILVFESGTISAMGSHDELMAKEGWYQRNFTEQANAYQAGVA